MRRNRLEILNLILPARRIVVEIHKFLYQKDSILMSFIKRYRKVVVILLTAHNGRGQVDEEIGKQKLS